MAKRLVKTKHDLQLELQAVEDRVNLTDPDAKLQPAYNTQLAVQADSTAPLAAQVIKNHPQTRRVPVDTDYDNTARIYQIEKTHRVIVCCPPEKCGREAKPETRESHARRRIREFRQGMKAACEVGSDGAAGH